MSRASVLSRGRAFAGGGFEDTCRIDRVASVDTNPLNGQVTKSRVIVYEGACRVQQAAAPWAGPATIGQAGIGLSALELQLPVAGSEDVTKDDRVTILTATYDAALAGKVFTVQGAHHATHKTTRRLPLQEILG